MPLKRDLNIPVLDLDDQPVLGEDKLPLSVRKVVVQSLLARSQDEPTLDIGEQMKRYHLSKRINRAAGAIELSSEDVTLMKALVAKAFMPVIVGFVADYLDTDPVAAA